MLTNHDQETGVPMEDGKNSSLAITLSIDAARKLISERHGRGMDADEPLMILVTLHGAFVKDYEKMLSHHTQAITTVISSAISGITDKALAEHLENQLRLADRIEQEFKRQYIRAKILSVINLFSALICIPVLVFLITK